MKKLKVFVTDDDQTLASSMMEKLELTGEVEICGYAGNGKAAVKALEDIPVADFPDVVIMDIEMPELDGIGATALIRKSFPDLKIIMFTVFDQDDKIFEAIRAGASGYILKFEKIARILESVKDVYDGGAPMSPAIASRVLKIMRSQAATETPADYQLTAREIDILEQIVNGLNYQQIAEKLFISPLTVRKHFQNIYEKLHVNNKVEAARMAWERKWF